MIKRTESKVILDIEADLVNPLFFEQYMDYGKTVEDAAVAIVQNIPNVKSFHIEPQGTQKGMFYK